MDYEKIIKQYPNAIQELKQAFTHTQALKCPHVIVGGTYIVPIDDRDLETFFNRYHIWVTLLPIFYKRQNAFVPCVSFLNDTNYVLVSYGDYWNKVHYTEFPQDNYIAVNLNKEEAMDKSFEKAFELLEAKLTGNLSNYTN